MKRATFKNGQVIERKTCTRDYKFAYKVITTKGNIETGFSTTKENAEKVAKSLANAYLSLAKNGGNKISDELIQKTKQSLATIEVVECETL